MFRLSRPGCWQPPVCGAADRCRARAEHCPVGLRAGLPPSAQGACTKLGAAHPAQLPSDPCHSPRDAETVSNDLQPNPRSRKAGRVQTAMMIADHRQRRKTAAPRPVTAPLRMTAQACGKSVTTCQFKPPASSLKRAPKSIPRLVPQTIAVGMIPGLPPDLPNAHHSARRHSCRIVDPSCPPATVRNWLSPPIAANNEGSVPVIQTCDLSW